MFNALASLGVLVEASVADLFAGSGALGIEALSRGADSCVFVESDPRALAVIRENVRTLGLDSRAEVLAGRAEQVVSTLDSVDLVLADPPYEFDRWGDLLATLESVVSDDGIVVIESGTEVASHLPESTAWEVVRSKRYGRTWVAFLRRC